MNNNNAPLGLRGAGLIACFFLAAGCTSFTALEPEGTATAPPGTDRAADAKPRAAERQAALAPLEAPRIDRLRPPVSPPEDLLERLRRGFVLPDADDESVGRELRWYASHADYVERVISRGQSYLYYIVERLAERGMPTDLALLPVVESAFDPFAYSHGRAAGLWQIIPGTGRRLGLKQNWWFDGRRDVVDSTRAALDYLEALGAQFGNDWLLAVAGYNSGEGNVARARARAAAAGQPADFWHIRDYLPRETRTYVPRFLAIRNLVARPAAYDVALPSIPNEPRLAVVETSGQIDMALAAKLAGIDVAELYRFNPGVNRWATDPDGPHRLIVPIDRREALADGLLGLGARERVQWTRHRIVSGETLGGLAREYGTTAALLRDINGLPNDTVRAGDYLMIPHAMQSLEAYTNTLDARNARQRALQHDGARQIHVVARGESLWSIARQYQVNLRELASWNAMAPGDVLSVGRKLVVWSGEARTVTPAATSTPIPERIRKIDYVVKRGDSLAAIARRFRVAVGQLVDWNDLSIDDYLQPGQRLLLYVDVTEQSS